MSFLHPALLWLAGGAVLPLIVHLFHRQKPRMIRFPAVRFVRTSRRRSVRRHRLKYLLLLLLRMGLLVLFALLLARPFVGGGVVAQEGEAGTPAAVVVVDDSLSMNYTVGDMSWFDTARGRALDLVRRLPPSGAAAVLTASRPTGKLVREMEEVAARVRGLKPTNGSAPLWRALQSADELLSTGAAGRRDIYVLTDMTPGAWPGYEHRVQELGPETSVYIADCGADDASNGAVTDVQDEGQPALRGGRLGIRATVRASGGPLSRTVQFEMDGKALGRQSVELAAGEETTVRFVAELAESGHHWGRFRFLSPDSLPQDDERSFTLEVASEVTVLCVEDEVGPEGEAASYFLRLALNPWGQEERSPFRVETVTGEQLADLSLGPYDVVALVEAGNIPEAAWRRLGAFVSGGGGLLAFCGPETAESWRTDEARGVLGAAVGQEVTAPSGEAFGLRIVRSEHPLVQAIAESGASLGQGRFWGCRRLSPSGTAEEVLSLGPDLPGLLLDRRGGRVALFASTAGDRWGLFARTPAFVPFCQETVLYLGDRATSGVEAYTVGAQVPIRFETSRWPTIVSVRPPGAESPERLLPGTTPGRRTYWKTDQPGYYAVEFERRDERWPGGFAVNPASIESRVEKVPFPALAEAIKAETVELLGERMASDGGAGPAGSVELTPYLVGLALAMLLAECYLANRFYGMSGQTGAAEPAATSTEG
ncbi:MAG: BatA domain-containing protein [Candidatus Brocadiia bacterium]